MPLVTALTGTWTWDGTTTVFSTDTSGVVVDDYIKMDDESPAFKVTAVVANTSVTIDNPEALTIPTGTGASKTDEPIRDEILAAADVQMVPEPEVVTQPDDPPVTIPVALAGTWTWDGTTGLVVSGVGSVTDAVVGDHIHLTGDTTKCWKISDISGLNVTIENPNNLAIPSGTGATKCLVRRTKDKHSSATVHVGKTYELTYQYINADTNVKDWAAMSGVDEGVV